MGALTIYLSTFIAYVILNGSRAVYSFCKPFIKQTYSLSDMALTLTDAALYTGLGIAFLLQSLLSSHKKSEQVKEFFLVSVLVVGCFGAVAGLSFVSESESATQLVIILIFLYGFCQFKFLPVYMSLLNYYFTPERDGGMLGFWASSRNFGSIGGYLGASLMVLTLEW